MAFQPTGRDLHVDTLLTNILIAYRNNEYIADQVFPIVEVNKQSDLIPSYDRSPWYRDEARMRAPGTKSQRGGWTVGPNDTYFARRYSYAHEIADEDRDNADSIWNLERDATEFVGDKMYMRREISLATRFFTTGVWNVDRVGTTDFTQWSDYANASPLTDMTTWMDAMEIQIGREPNQMVMGKQVWNVMKWHPDVIDTIKYTQRGVVTMDLLRELFEVERILIGKAIYTADPEGTAEASVTYSRIWGKHMLLMYTPGRPAILQPSAGYTFVWRRVPNALQWIKRMRDEEREVDIVEGNSYFDQKLVGSKAGAFHQNIVA